MDRRIKKRQIARVTGALSGIGLGITRAPLEYRSRAEANGF